MPSTPVLGWKGIVLLMASMSIGCSALESDDDRLVVIELDSATDRARATVVEAQELERRQSEAHQNHKVLTAVRIDPISGQVDPLDAGLPWYWLAFGFGAQILFTARMLVQWIASERAKASVVPSAFWVLSALGGLMLMTYFLRRGDPVGVTGQSFGLAIYARNLIFIRRGRSEKTPSAELSEET
ncbi:MAG: lipid-A-disaccharide synthase N-terminal domain-containing protein [Myxococcota bacterium]